MSKYGVFSGPNTGRYGPEKTPYFDTFHVVLMAIPGLQSTDKHWQTGWKSPNAFICLISFLFNHNISNKLTSKILSYLPTFHKIAPFFMVPKGNQKYYKPNFPIQQLRNAEMKFSIKFVLSNTYLFRSNCFYRTAATKILTKFTGIQLRRSHSSATSMRLQLQHRCSHDIFETD